MLRRRALSAALALLLPMCLAATPVCANCTNPAGKEGDQVYNYDYHTFQFCNGTGWLAYGGGSACTPVGNYSPTAPSGSGYFVLTSTTYDGNLGGRIGADASCLTELTTNTNWMGYATANSNGQLVASKVHAWICDGSICNNLMPLTAYYFANAGDSGAGGASFTTDSSGNGPNDSAFWTAANYFSGSYNYWTSRGATSCNGSTWSSIGGSPCSGAHTHCSGYTTSSGTAGAGSSNSSGVGRFNAGNSSCTSTLHILCFVNP